MSVLAVATLSVSALAQPPLKLDFPSVSPGIPAYARLELLIPDFDVPKNSTGRRSSSIAILTVFRGLQPRDVFRSAGLAGRALSAASCSSRDMSCGPTGRASIRGPCTS
jgi:hypothetical protein